MNYVGKETYLVNDTLFSKETVEQYLEKRDVKIDKKKKQLEAMLSNMGKTQRMQGGTNVSSVTPVMTFV